MAQLAAIGHLQAFVADKDLPLPASTEFEASLSGGACSRRSRDIAGRLALREAGGAAISSEHCRGAGASPPSAWTMLARRARAFCSLWLAGGVFSSCAAGRVEGRQTQGGVRGAASWLSSPNHQNGANVDVEHLTPDEAGSPRTGGEERMGPAISRKCPTRRPDAEKILSRHSGLLRRGRTFLFRPGGRDAVDSRCRRARVRRGLLVRAAEARLGYA